MNDAQRILRQAYGGGDYADVETTDEARDVGDTLFTFLWLELSDAEGCDGPVEGLRRVGAAVRDLEVVQRALYAGLSTPDTF